MDTKSLKGKVFTPQDLRASTRSSLTEEQQQVRVDALTERYRIVATDGDEAICAEELIQRVLNKLSPKVKRIAGAMMLLTPEARLEVIQAFDAEGGLINPFSRPMHKKKK